MSEPSFFFTCVIIQRDAEVLAGPPVGHEGPGQLPQNVPYAMFELSTLEVLGGNKKSSASPGVGGAATRPAADKSPRCAKAE